MNSNDRKVTFAGIGVLLVMLISALLFGSNASGGEGGGGSSTTDILLGYVLYTDKVSFSGDLSEGSSETQEMDLSGMLVKNISVTLTWTDESKPPGRPRIRQYTNAPDTFSVSISDMSGNRTSSDTGANPPGQEGSISLQLSIPDEDLLKLLDEDYQGEVWTVLVSMEDAGNWAPRIGIIGFNDPGNSYSLVVDYEYYKLAEIRGE